MIRERAAHAKAFSMFRRPAAVLVAAAIAGTALPALANPGACFSRSEHAAEQALRMHTEMMIVGLTCQQIKPDKNPFGKYQDFTVKHRTMISTAEGQIISHMKKASKGNATRNFDMYRTELANESSRRAAIIGTPLYCGEFVERSQTALSLSPDEIKTLTADEKNAGLMHLSSRPLCDVKVVSLPDPPAPVAAVQPPRGKDAKTPPKKDGKAPAKTPAPAKPPAKGKPQTASADVKR